MIAMLADIGHTQQQVRSDPLIDSEIPFFDSGCLEIRLNTRGGSFGVGQIRRDLHRKCSWRGPGSERRIDVEVVSDGAAIAAGAHVIELAVVSARCRMNGGF